MLALVGSAPKRPEIVSISPGNPLELKAGGKAEYSLSFKILGGYHIQANPASEQYLIATTVGLDPVEGIIPEAPVYPKGVAFKLKGSDKEIQTYENENTIRIPLQADASTAPGEKVLKGTFHYQGCDATTCFPPKTIPFEAKVNVLKP